MTQTVLEPSIAIAFLAGIASFLSPCVFPLVPGYLSALAVGDSGTKRSSLLFPTALFIAGFSFVFSLMGTLASFLGSFLIENKGFLATVSGVLIMVMGLFTMEVVKIPMLQREKTLRLPENGGLAYVFLIGCAFAIGWTPCIGPMLASILSYAAVSGEPAKGFVLLLTYCTGLGTPFIAAALFFGWLGAARSAVGKYYFAYKYVVGAMMVAMGFLISVDGLFYLNIYGQKVFDLLGIDLWMRI